MLSGILDFFTGGSSDKKTSYEDHIVPVIHQSGRQLTYTDCFHWLDRKVVLQLIRFERPQIGTVKYIGSDMAGTLCAGIEFEYDIGGTSGRVNGQKLFKCKSGHGLLVPVEYIQLLEDYENGTNIFPINQLNASSSLNRAQSVPNLSSRNANLKHIAVEDYIPELLSELKVGDNVVWLGGSTAQTGIVRWIGRVGRTEQTPIKVWMEMDEFMGFGCNEIDVGTKFGCLAGRGKLLPVEELILLENFIPGDNNCETNQQVDNVVSNLSEFDYNVHATAPTLMECSNSADDLIDFTADTGQSELKVEEPTLADQDFNQLLREHDKEVESKTTDKSQSPELNNHSFCVFPTADIVREFSPLGADVDNLPLQSFLIDDHGHYSPVPTVPAEIAEISEPNEHTVQQLKLETDVNGNVSAASSQEREKINLSNNMDMDDNYLPPFIVPPINILEFFKADGLKGIQGKRNSCYIDVVLFSMFAFTDTFDPYFLVKTNHFSKGPDAQYTKIAKKIMSEHIVNPLRQNYYCPATGVNFLRDIMIPFSDKLDGAFLDIEEFMLILFDKLFNLKEFISYDNEMKDYLHQVNLGDHVLPSIMTVKQCLEMSMLDYGLKFQGIPSPAFIIQIPRNTYGIIQSTTIVPNLSLDLSTLMKTDEKMDTGVFSVIMNLVAVICINDFHFVTFVKCGSGLLSHWVLFDSNPSEERPKVEIVPNIGEWLESLEHQCLTNPGAVIDKKSKFPPMVQRLLSDIYVCIYCPAHI